MDPEFMRLALRLARDHMVAGDGGPFGAVVVRDGEIIGKGWNRVSTAHDPTAHAEIEAIRAACQVISDFSLKGCEIYASCEPCPMCLAACHWARLDRVYYAGTREDAAAAGFDDALLYRELAARPADRRLPMEPLLRDEAALIFSLWRAKTNRVLY